MNNLIENPTFEHQAKGWEILNDNDLVISDHLVEINRDQWAKDTVELWSQPINVIATDNYLLSFDVWVADITKLGTPDVAVIIRCFNDLENTGHPSAISWDYPSLKQSGVTSGTWQTIQTVVNTPAKYARVGIWFKTGHVKIKNISFTELSTESLFYDKNGMITYKSPYQLPKPAFLPLGQLNTRNAQEEYDLDFSVRVDDISGFFEQDSFFVVLESDQPFDLTQLNFVDFDSEAAQKLSINFENLTSNKWKRLTNTYRFDKSYVLYGAYLAGKGKVEIKNIKFDLYQPAPVQKTKPKRQSTSRKRGAL